MNRIKSITGNLAYRYGKIVFKKCLFNYWTEASYACSVYSLYWKEVVNDNNVL